MPPKANLRSEDPRVEIPSFPLIGANARAGPSISSRAIERADAMLRAGEDSAARRALREAADAVREPREAAEILLVLGQALVERERLDAGRVVLHEALDAARASTDPAVIARARAALAGAP